MRQDVHAEDAIEAPDIDWLRQVHGVERHQAAQAWLHQQIRASIPVGSCSVGSVAIPILSSIRCVGAYLREASSNRCRRQAHYGRVRIYPSLCNLNGGTQEVCAHDMDRAFLVETIVVCRRRVFANASIADSSLRIFASVVAAAVRAIAVTAPHRLTNCHCNGVRFFAAAASRAPDTKRGGSFAPFSGEDLRGHLTSQRGH